MQVELFFNRPLAPWPTTRLLDDIRAATSRIAIASAWFTSRDIANAFLASPAPVKLAVFNRSDLNRPGSRGIWDDYVAEAHRCADEYYAKIDSLPDDDPGKDYGAAPFHMALLGSEDFKEGVMHHKFIVVDDEVSWCGSYNFTYQAQKNYETILRIRNRGIASQFWAEASLLVHSDSALWSGSNQCAITTDGRFRCYSCEKLCTPNQNATPHESTGWLCKQCLASGRG